MLPFVANTALAATPAQSADPQLNMALGQLVTNEVRDPDILNAMVTVPRGVCVPPALADAACVDEDLPLGGGRALLAPLTFARLIQLAAITPADNVLDIGCLYGYSTAVIASLAKQVTGCDTQNEMTAAATRLFAHYGLANARAFTVQNLADGYAGNAPYNVILINGAIERVPPQLVSLLSDDGRLVAVERRRTSEGLVDGSGILAVYSRLSSGMARRVTRDSAAPLLPGFALHKGFVF